MQDPEKKLIDDNVVLAQRGHSEGFDFLWHYYAPRIRSYISCRINQKNDADDLVSEIFIKAFSKIDSFDVEKAAFSTWLFTITKNVLIDYFGSFNLQIHWLDSSSMEDMERQGQIKSMFNQFESSVEELDTRADNHEELIKKIEDVLDQLPKQYAELIRMKFFFNMDNKEIASIKSKTQGNIRVALHRALQHAEKLIKGLNL